MDSIEEKLKELSLISERISKELSERGVSSDEIISLVENAISVCENMREDVWRVSEDSKSGKLTQEEVSKIFSSLSDISKKIEESLLQAEKEKIYTESEIERIEFLKRWLKEKFSGEVKAVFFDEEK